MYEKCTCTLYNYLLYIPKYNKAMIEENPFKVGIYTGLS